MTATGIDSLASGSDTAERTRIAAPPAPSGAAPDIEPDTTEPGADPIASPEQPHKPLIKRAEFWTAIVALGLVLMEANQPYLQ